VPSFRVDYFEKGKPVGWIELARLEGGSGATTSGEVQDNIYARSEHTVGWTRLPQRRSDRRRRREARRSALRCRG
jgi:hypothetical protein